MKRECLVVYSRADGQIFIQIFRGKAAYRFV